MADLGRYTNLIPANKGTTTPTTNFGRYTNLIPKKETPVVKKAGILPTVNKVLGGIDSLTARPAEGSEAEKSTLRQLPSAIAENLPFGIGSIVRTAREEPEVVADLTAKDVLKGVGETFRDYVVKYPLIAASNLAGKPVKFTIPGIGDITNRQFNSAERIRNGENQAQVMLEEGAGSIFDTLFLVGLGQKVFGGRPTTIAKADAPKDGGISIKQPAKSFRLYEEPTNTQPISPEFMQKMATEQGITIKNYNPKLPTYFRITGKGSGSVVGEVVQIKPSYFETFVSKLKGDVNKVPPENIISIASKQTTMKALEEAKPEPQVPMQAPIVPATKPTIIPPNIVPPAVPTEPIVAPKLPTPTPPKDLGRYNDLVPQDRGQSNPTPQYKTTLETFKKGETIVAHGKSSGKSNSVKFISFDDKGVMATEPTSGLPMRFRHEIFDFTRPQATTVNEEVKDESSNSLSEASNEFGVFDKNKKLLGFVKADDFDSAEKKANELFKGKYSSLIQKPTDKSVLTKEVADIWNKANETEEVKRVSGNLLKHNPAISQTDAEAMARDLVRNRVDKKPAVPYQKKNEKQDEKRIGMMDYDPSYTPRINALIKEAQKNGDLFPYTKMTKEEQGIVDKVWRDRINAMVNPATKKPGEILGDIISYKMDPGGEEGRAELAARILESIKKNPEEAARIATISREELQKHLGETIYRAGDPNGMSWTFDENVAKGYRVADTIVHKRKLTQDIIDHTIFYEGVDPKKLGFIWDDYKEISPYMFEDELLLNLKGFKEKKSASLNRLTLEPTKAKTSSEIAKESEKVFGKEKIGQSKYTKGLKPFADKATYEKSAIGKTDLKNLFAKGGEFRNNPVLTVNTEKDLVFEGKKLKFKIKADALGLNKDKLKVGSKIEVDEKSLKEKGAGQQMRVYSSNGVEADIGVFKDDTPVKAGHLDKIQPIEMPELVELARDLLGVPQIRRTIGKKLGVFRHNDLGAEIRIKADTFKDPVQAAKILAHEIGHLVDYLPDRMMKRGNLLGHLLTLSNFRKNVFEDIIAKNSDLKKELMAVSLYWRPIYEEEIIEDSETGLPKIVKKEIPLDQAPASFQAYRKSAKELYADAISMLLNSPGLLQEKAPIFYKEFFDKLDRKPEVRDAYFELQARLNGDRQTVINARREGVRGMFKEGDYKAWELQAAKEAEKQKRDRNFLFRFKFELVDRNQALIDRVNQAQKEGKMIPQDENPLYYLEERNYVGGKQKALMEKYFAPTYKNLRDAGISWTDFGEIMFYRRIVSGDRSEQANPRGITPQAAKELLETVESGMSSDQLKVVSDSLAKFREGMMKVNEEAYNEGMYTPELYQQMRENPDYVSFRVLDHLEDSVTSKIYKSIGTLKDIQNPADASIMKTLAVLRAVEYQKTKRSVVDFLQRNNPKDIKEAQTRWSGKRQEFIESKKDREELVMLYSKTNKGKMEGYYVDPYIKASLENQSVGSNNLIIGSLKLANSMLFRPLYIGFNPGFQVFNLLRDFQRFWKNVPTMTIGRAMKRYMEALPAAKARAFGDGSKEAMETIIEMEEKQILSVTFNDLVKGENVEDIQLHTILKNSGIDSFTTPKKVPMLMKPILATLDFVKKVGDLIETLPKVAGYYEFTGNRSKPISKEDASFIRNNVGSPDFLAGGHLKPATNEVFLFSNAITQGLRADYNIATNPRTRSGYWWKTAKMNFTPKLLMYLAVLGVFGETIRKIMEGATEYDKTNYIVVPLGFDENGKSVYMRIPQDETGRLLSGLTWKILNSANNQQNLTKDVVDIVSFTGGQLPSLNPIIQDISATTQFLAGQNPYDFFRNREVLSEDAYKAGGSTAFKQFAGWMFNQNGGSIFYRFYNEPSVPQPKSGAEQVFNLPVLGNIAGRFVRITDYGVRENINKVKQEAVSEDAQRRIDEKAFVSQYIEKYQKGEGDERVLIDQMISDKFEGRYPTSKEDIETAKRLKARFQTSIDKGYASSNVRAVFDATSNNEKRAIIIYLKDTLSEEDYKKFKDEALKTKATTPEVFYEAENKK